MANTGVYKLAAVSMVFGVTAFIAGFVRLRRQKKILDTPTARARSVALGFCELSGTAKMNGKLWTTPQGIPGCVYFQSIEEELRRHGKHRSWVPVNTVDSSAHPFLLNDGTGQVLVNPKDAELYLKSHQKRTTNISNRRRIREQWITDQEPVFVLGYLNSTSDAKLSDVPVRLRVALDQIRRDPKQMAAADTNKDGQVSGEEWEQVRLATQGALIENIQKNPDPPTIQKRTGEHFIISTMTEPELTRHLFLRSWLGIIGGPILTLIGILLLKTQLD